VIFQDILLDGDEARERDNDGEVDVITPEIIFISSCLVSPVVTA
jgi:hypothetical protein